MSMPSSSDDVATRHGISPFFSSSSISSRCSRASEPWWARAISCARPPRLLVRQLVQAQRQALGEPAVVDEDDRRAVLLDELRGSPGRSTARSSSDSPGSRMSSSGTTTFRSSSFARPASTSSIGRPPETKRPISSIGRCVAERPIALDGLLGQAVEPLDGQREVGAALRPGDGVHLVEDQRLDATSASRARAR